VKKVVKFDEKIDPILKWVGGKSDLLSEINKLIPKSNSYKTYIEPFIGGGSVLFYIKPKKAIINDINKELINTYDVIKNNSNEVIDILSAYRNEKEFYYSIRNLDRNNNYINIDNITKAARFIYINKVGFRGLYRVNNKGELNVSYGYYKKPNFINETGIKKVNRYLTNNDITIINNDFSQLINNIDNNCFVYLDPPYDTSINSKFTKYTSEGFTQKDHIRVFDFCKEIDGKGGKFLLSSSNTEFIKSLYNCFLIKEVSTKRKIKSTNKCEDLFIFNYTS
jgi:DNA adenine methylase